MGDIVKAIGKEITSFKKPYAGLEDAIREAFFYLLGILIEGAKQVKAPEGKVNIKGWLFVWPFVIAFFIVLYLIASIFIVE